MKKNRNRERGFTLIEVLMALLVFMIAMLGLVAMQRASISGANSGREQTAAVNVARFVMTWLENEAASWPLADTTATPPTAQFPLLNEALSDTTSFHSIANQNTLRFDPYLETSATTTSSYGAGAVDTAPFCVGYRVEPLGGTDQEDRVAYRVWVRVTWPRWGEYGGDNWNKCNLRITDQQVKDGNFQVVELSGVVTREFTGRWSGES